MCCYVLLCVVGMLQWKLDIRAQTHGVIANLRRVLATAGADWLGSLPRHCVFSDTLLINRC